MILECRTSTIAACLLLLSACQQENTISRAEADTPYAVGSSTFFMHDESRGYDSVAGIDAGVRTLITEIWYPIEHESVADGAGPYRRATYGDYVFGDAAMHRRMMTQTTFFT